MTEPNRPQLSLGLMALWIAVIAVAIANARILIDFFYPGTFP